MDLGELAGVFGPSVGGAIFLWWALTNRQPPENPLGGVTKRLDEMAANLKTLNDSTIQRLSALETEVKNLKDRRRD